MEIWIVILTLCIHIMKLVYHIYQLYNGLTIFVPVIFVSCFFHVSFLVSDLLWFSNFFDYEKHMKLKRKSHFDAMSFYSFIIDLIIFLTNGQNMKI